MPLQLQPLEPSDLEAWARLFYQSFQHTTVACLWHCEPSAESYTLFAQGRGQALLERDPNVYMLKVIDTDLPDDDAQCKAINNGVGNRLVAVGYWRVHRRERSKDEVERGNVLPATFPEENRAARAKFMQKIWQSRLVYQTQPHISLETLVTHPMHQRRGAGAMIVSWGCQKADELGLVAYLEASAAGRGLYKKYGFQEQAELVTDLGEFGGTIDTHVAMLRLPSTELLHQIRPVERDCAQLPTD
jgi:ribosomal protein S18 acetylase RimI-like enzyme